MCGVDGLTYYSPCFAGCMTASPYTNCSCVGACAGGGSCAAGTVTEGACASSCHKLPSFSVALAFGMFFLFASAPPALTLIMRALPHEHVSVCLAVIQTLWKVGSFPGPIFMGAMFDARCVYSQYNCATDSNTCVLYDNDSLASAYAALGIALKAGATVLYFGAWWAYRNRKPGSWWNRGTRSVGPEAVVVPPTSHASVLPEPSPPRATVAMPPSGVSKSTVTLTHHSSTPRDSAFVSRELLPVDAPAKLSLL